MESTAPITARERDDETTRIRCVRPPSAVRRDRCTLTVLAGPLPGRVVAVDRDSLVLGRCEEADVHLDDRGLSRTHVRIFRRQDTWYVEDLDSTNGTWVQGDRLCGARQLAEGDRIQLGEGVLLKTSLQDALEQQATRRLYESAVLDPLTRVHNRRYLDERLEEELAFAQRHHTCLSLLLLDIDHFKRINDTLGHQAGDAVLRVVAGTLHKMIRTEDLVARYGGEEFVVVARGIDAANAMIFAERIRRLVAGLSIPWEGRPVHVTVSIGVATFSVERRYGRSTDLVEDADRALYRAKESGRNRCCPAG